MNTTRTIKVWLNIYRVLKVLVAQRGETLVEMIDRLAKDEQRRTASKDTDQDTVGQQGVTQ
jgi:hypothetical protein